MWIQFESSWHLGWVWRDYQYHAINIREIGQRFLSRNFIGIVICSVQVMNHIPCITERFGICADNIISWSVACLWSAVQCYNIFHDLLVEVYLSFNNKFVKLKILFAVFFCNSDNPITPLLIDFLRRAVNNFCKFSFNAVVFALRYNVLKQVVSIFLSDKRE